MAFFLSFCCERRLASANLHVQGGGGLPPRGGLGGGAHPASNCCISVIIAGACVLCDTAHMGA